MRRLASRRNEIAYFWWEKQWQKLALSTFAELALWCTTLVAPRNLLKILADITIATTTKTVMNQTTGELDRSGGSTMTWDVFFSFELNRTAESFDPTKDPIDWAYFTTCA